MLRVGIYASISFYPLLEKNKKDEEEYEKEYIGQWSYLKIVNRALRNNGYKSIKDMGNQEDHLQHYIYYETDEILIEAKKKALAKGKKKFAEEATKFAKEYSCKYVSSALEPLINSCL